MMNVERDLYLKHKRMCVGNDKRFAQRMTKTHTLKFRKLLENVNYNTSRWL